MKRVNVLVTATGTGIGQSIIKGLRLSGEQYNIVGTDITAWSAGIYRCNKGYLVPPANDDLFIPKIIEIAEKENINVIIPGCDPELPVFALARKKIESQTNAIVVIGSSDAVKICRDKYLTSIFLEKHGFPCPRSALPNNVDSLIDDVGFPLVIKPRKKSGTTGVHVVFNRKELEYYITPDCIIQEYIPAANWKKKKSELTKKDVYMNGLLNQTDEYSVEVLVSKDGEIIGSIANWRTMKKGYPIRAIINKYDNITKIAEEISLELSRVGLRGPCNLQCRVGKEGPVFFEINPRFSGSTAIRCAAGFNGPDVIIKNFLFDEPVEKLKKQLKYRNLIEIRWWNELYLDPLTFNKLKKGGFIKFSGNIYNYF